MVDDTDSVAQDEMVRPWLSPSEALTRFVPQQQIQYQAAEVKPIRFGYRVANIGFLVPAKMRSELVDKNEIYPVPTTPIWFPGLINLRGGLVPVFDLKKLFKIDNTGGEKRNLLVLNAEADAVGVLIDGLPQTIETNQLIRHPPLPDIVREHSRAVYGRGQEIWVEFDFDGFFLAAGSRIAV